MNAHHKKAVILLTLAAILLSFGVRPRSAQALSDYGAVGAAATAAQTAAQAAGTAGSVVAGKSTAAVTYKEYVLDTIATAMAKSLMQQVTKSTVKWIKSGFQGQPFVPEDYQKWAQNAGDKAGGMFLDKLTEGKFSQFCTNPGFNIGLSLPRAEPFEIQTKCSLSEFGNNWQTAYDSAAKGDWSAWLQISRPENNPYGQLLLSWEEQNRIKTVATTKEQTDLALNKGTLSLREHSTDADPVCVDRCQTSTAATVAGQTLHESNSQAYLEDCIQSCVAAGSEKTTTPGAIINDQLTQQLGGGWKRLEAADELNEVIGALIDYALGQVQNGLVTRTGSTKYSSSPSYTGGNLYSTFRKTYTLGDVKTDIFKMKYALYDGKILNYDSGFKPGQDGSDDEAKTTYTRLYAQLKKGATGFISGETSYNVDCQIETPDDRLDPRSIQKHPSGNVWDWGFWDKNCGVLAYNTFRNKNTGEIMPAGFDMVKRSPNVGPPGQALLWYRKFPVKRLEIMFSELIEAYTQTSVFNSENAAGIAQQVCVKDGANTSDRTCTPAITAQEVRCQYIDYRDADYETTKGLLARDMGTLKDDINDIEGYYGVNGTYDNLMSLIKEAEKAVSEINTEDANASTTIQNIAENLLTLKTRMPSLSEKITKRIDDMGYYARGTSCDSTGFTATTTDGQTYGYGELGCMAKAEKLKNEALAANPNAVFSKTDIQRFNSRKEDAAADANMHCWVEGLKYDKNDNWSSATPTTKDTCDGKTNEPYTCAASDSLKCTDVASNIEASATGGTGGGGGSQNQGGSAGTAGSASVGTKYSQRQVTCVSGAGIDPNANAGGGGPGGGHGGPTYMCSPGKPPTPYPNTGENYYRVAQCTSWDLCDTYYRENKDCYADLSMDTQYGGDEHAMIHAMDNLCFNECTNALDDGVTKNANGQTWVEVGYHANGGSRYQCHADHKGAAGSGC